MKHAQIHLILFLLLFFGTYSLAESSFIELPNGVKVSKGQLHLYADFANVEKDYLPVYLINATDKDIQLPHQDGDVYLKLEGQNSQGDGKERRDISIVFVAIVIFPN